jgi:alkaline phosphatase D
MPDLSRERKAISAPAVKPRRPSILLLLLVGLTGCASESRPGLPPGSPFAEDVAVANETLTHGVASGEVTNESALVWFRTAGPAQATVEWAPDSADGGTGALRSAAMTTSQEHDFIAAVRLDGLRPATRYRYRVLTGEAQAEAGAGRFVTAADSTVSQPVTFLWSGDIGGQGHCRDQQTGYRIFDLMAGQRPAFLLLLGDTIYGDDRCPSPPNVAGSDFLATTLDGYRAKHRYQREDQALRRFLTSVPVYAVWDDHEVRNNFSGPGDPLMAVGRQAFMEYWPIGTPPEDPHRLYRSFRRGADLELFILDTRQYRSANAEPDGARKTMLGKAQRDWLLEGLARSTATWKIIATVVPLAVPKAGSKLVPGNDSWAPGADGTGFQTELRLIVNELLARRIRNVVWLVTDVHFAQVNAYDPDGDGQTDFHEFICGPLAANPGKLALPDAAFRPTTLYSATGFMNFGKVTVLRDSLTLEIIDETGTSRFAQTFPSRS